MTPADIREEMVRLVRELQYENTGASRETQIAVIEAAGKVMEAAAASCGQRPPTSDQQRAAQLLYVLDCWRVSWSDFGQLLLRGDGLKPGRELEVVLDELAELIGKGRKA